jgi:SAM-dependent methyltransferase
MGQKRVQRVGVREGYDLWSATYDETPNPIVAMDSRYAIGLLKPKEGEWILDAGCGTGRNLRRLKQHRAQIVGIDFSLGMLRIARQRIPDAALAQADLQHELPLRPAHFDAVLCTLIGEHLAQLGACLAQLYSALKPGGRMVFTVYHPDLAAAGKEANFGLDAVEYRLGAIRYSSADYLNFAEDVGFAEIRSREYRGDEELAARIPSARDLVGRNVLLAIEAARKY